MEYKVGDIVKRIRGLFTYRVISNTNTSIYGKYTIRNLNTGCMYTERLKGPLWVKCVPPEPIKLKRKKIRFKFI
jgi:hypothetical protein